MSSVFHKKYTFFTLVCLLSVSPAYGMRQALTGTTPRAPFAPFSRTPIAFGSRQSLSQAFAGLSLTPHRIQKRLFSSPHEPANLRHESPKSCSFLVRVKEVIAHKISDKKQRDEFKKKLFAMLETDNYTEISLYDDKDFQESMSLLPYYMGTDQKFADALYNQALLKIKEYRGGVDPISPKLLGILIFFSPRCKELYQAMADNIINMQGHSITAAFTQACILHQHGGHTFFYDNKLTIYENKEEFDRVMQECKELITAAQIKNPHRCTLYHRGENGQLLIKHYLWRDNNFGGLTLPDQDKVLYKFDDEKDPW